MKKERAVSPAFALALGAVVLAGCALFLLCYRYDNKYTAPRPAADAISSPPLSKPLQPPSTSTIRAAVRIPALYIVLIPRHSPL